MYKMSQRKRNQIEKKRNIQRLMEMTSNKLKKKKKRLTTTLNHSCCVFWHIAFAKEPQAHLS